MGGTDGDEDGSRTGEHGLDLVGPVGVATNQQGFVKGRGFRLHFSNREFLEARHVTGRPGGNHLVQFGRAVAPGLQQQAEGGQLISFGHPRKDADLFVDGLERLDGLAGGFGARLQNQLDARLGFVARLHHRGDGKDQSREPGTKDVDLAGRHARRAGDGVEDRHLLGGQQARQGTVR